MKNRFKVGDKVLASRDESGENHEPGNVVDSYELIIGEEHKPMVVVEFEDGERKYMTATSPNVLLVEEDEEEEVEVTEELETEDDDVLEADDEDEADEGDEDEVLFIDEEEGASP